MPYTSAEILRPRVVAVRDFFAYELSDFDLNLLGLVYLSSEKPVKAMATVFRVADQYGPMLDYKFILRVHIEAFAALPIGKQNMVLYHELLHIRKNDRGNYYLADHDVKDFKRLLNCVGLDWDKNEASFAQIGQMALPDKSASVAGGQNA